MDGKIVIGTEIDTKGFDYGLKDLEKETQNKISKLGLEEQFQQAFNEINKSMNEVYPEIEKLSLKIGELVEEYNLYANIKPGDPYFERDAQHAEELKQEIIEVSKQIENLTGEKFYIKGITDADHDFKNINNSLKNIGNSVENVIKKIGKWALAIFGIRSAYSLVRSAISTLSQYNEQMAVDVEYIRFAIASTLKPLIEYIISLVYKLLGLIGSIAKSIFGVNIFANASAKAFSKTAKAIGGANKNAKELKKTLTGFDQINILQEDGSTTLGGGGGGVGLAPSMDLSNLGNTDLSGVTHLVDRIKDIFIKGFEYIKFNIGKIMLDLGFSSEFVAQYMKVADDAIGIFSGAFDVISGLFKTLIGIITGDTELVKTGISQAVNGLVQIIKNAATYVIDLIKLIYITASDIGQKAVSLIHNYVIIPLGNLFAKLWDGIKNGLDTTANWIKTTFNNIVNFFKNVINSILSLFKIIGTKVAEIIAKSFVAVINGVLGAIENMLNFPIKGINKLLDIINGIPGINLKTLSTFKFPRLAKGGIINMPGRGVNYYGANVGERRPEGIVPLDNEASLRIIGETIAKHTKFSADITLELESRILARVMKEINTDRSFARNGG